MLHASLDSAFDSFYNFVSTQTYHISDCSKLKKTRKTNSDISSNRTLFTDFDIDIISKELPVHDTEIQACPKHNIFTTPNSTTVLELAVPGLNKDEIKIELKGLKLTVTGNVKKTDESSKTFIRKRIPKYDFEYVFCCIEEMDFEKITAVIENGILTIEIPLKDEAKPLLKEIAIQ